MRQRLLTLSAVTALVGGATPRIFVDQWPQAVTKPAIRVGRVIQTDGVHLRGPLGTSQSIVQVDVVAATKAQAVDILEAVHGDGLGTGASGLNGWIGSIGSPAFEVLAVLPRDARSTYEDEERREYIEMRTYLVLHRG